MPGPRNPGSRSVLFGTGALAGLLAVLTLYGVTGSAPRAPAAPQPLAAPMQGLSFEPAAGNEPSRFVTRAGGYAARIDPAGARIALRGAPGRDARAAPAVARVGLRLVAANPAAAGAGAGRIQGWSHYYLGSDPAAWREHVPRYPRIEYAAVYPGVDVAWHGERGGLEFDFIVAPGAEPRRIGLAFDDISGLRLAPSGELVLDTAAGELTLQRPLAWQDRAGGKEFVEAAFDVDGADGVVRFRVGPYDDTRRLVIDPVISYADYLGGSGDDAGRAIAVDASGNRYVSGSTISDIFAGETKPANTGTDVYIAKLTPGGTREYVTFIGEVGAEIANAIAVDGSGRAHVAGDTDSDDLPTNVSATAAQAVYGGGQDAFVARLDTDGTLDYLSYLGGTGQDSARALALGDTGDMYVGGSTLSEDFPTGDPLQAALAGTGDGFVARISALGGLVYSTYLGGSGGDNVWTLALDDAGAIYVGGSTDSDNFPTEGVPNAYQDTYGGGGSDGYVAKLAPDGAALEYSTYLGGNGLDRVLALAVGTVADLEGYAYVTGITSSTNFRISQGAPAYGGGSFDAFITRFMPDGTVADYSAFLGGDGEDQGLAIALSGESQVVIAGSTQSGDLDLTQPLQVQRLGVRDGFVIQVQLAGSVISQIFATYLGGTGDDAVTAVAATEGADEIHVAGTGSSGNLPTVLASQQGENAGGTDAFVMRIDRNPALALPDLRVSIDADPTPVPRRNDLTYTIQVDNEGTGDATGVLVQVEGANLSALSSPSTGCDALDGIAILCDGGDVISAGFQTLDITAVTDEIGPATLTATLVRADQSGISLGNNSASVERLVVDDSDQSSGLSWELLVLLGGVPRLLRRRTRAQAEGRRQ